MTRKPSCTCRLRCCDKGRCVCERKDDKGVCVDCPDRQKRRIK